MDLGLKGLRALVTGASRGLGYATALTLAQEGAEVIINSRQAENLAAAAAKIRSETGAAVRTCAANVSEAQAAENLIQETVKALGGLDLLVTNAGGPPPGAFESFDDQIWQQAVEISFLSHVRLIRAALPYLRQSSAASVLTVTSLSVKQPIPELILSNSVRAATIGLTKSLALELGREGLRFNSILPSWTETERVQELMENRARQRGTTVVEEAQKQSANSALGRMGSPQEFARVAAFLLSPAASYLTGVMLAVDGGMYKGIY